jgi:hypothetical protein
MAARDIEGVRIVYGANAWNVSAAIGGPLRQENVASSLGKGEGVAGSGHGDQWSLASIMNCRGSRAARPRNDGQRGLDE